MDGTSILLLTLFKKGCNEDKTGGGEWWMGLPLPELLTRLEP
jgi:hypothetical protein